MANTVEQARVVTTQSEIRPGQSVTELALFDTDGQPLDLSGGVAYTDADARAAIASKTQVAALTAATSANGVAAAGAEPTKAEYDAVVALVNELKGKVNGIIAALKA